MKRSLFCSICGKRCRKWRRTCNKHLACIPCLEAFHQTDDIKNCIPRSKCWCLPSKGLNIAKRSEIDDAVGEWMISNYGRACPNCNNAIEKVDGCCKVKCRCEKSFCWNCGDDAHSGFNQCGKKRWNEKSLKYVEPKVLSDYLKMPAVLLVSLILFLYFFLAN